MRLIRRHADEEVQWEEDIRRTTYQEDFEHHPKFCIPMERAAIQYDRHARSCINKRASERRNKLTESMEDKFGSKFVTRCTKDDGASPLDARIESRVSSRVSYIIVYSLVFIVYSRIEDLVLSSVEYVV